MSEKKREYYLNAVMRTPILWLLCSCICISCIGKNNDKKNMKSEERFEWRAGNTCPEMYPIRLLSGAFILNGNGEEEGYVPLMGVSFSRGVGWGMPGGAIGAGKSPAPDKLVICWLSWVEGKGYLGRFDLPKERITELFRNGYKNKFNERREYNHIVVGMAPKGVVIVWVWGNMSCVEVGRYQAVVDTTIAVKEFAPESSHDRTTYPTLAEYAKKGIENKSEILEYVSKHGLRDGIWDTYRKRFKLRPVVEYIGGGKGITDDIILEFYNGEYCLVAPDSLNWNTYYDFARVSKMTIGFSNGQELCEMELNFDEAEVLEAYKKMYGENRSQEVDLVVSVTPDNRIIRICLRKKTAKEKEEVCFKKVEIINWKIDDRSRSDFRVFNPFRVKE